jgi:hypothetical protein
MKSWTAGVVLLVLTATAFGQAWLDAVNDSLSLKTGNGFLRSDLSGLLDLEGYYVDQRPPGLLFEDESFFNPRLSLFLDTRLGDHFYSFVQARLDRGFDPGEATFQARADEYLLRWIPWTDGRLNVQFGKFATVVGSWVQRHDSWSNPLITAPLPYENLTPLSDDDPPASPADLLSYRRVADQKNSWLPIIWGPVYATGWSIFGTAGKFDYALEFKNAPPSSHPYAWELGNELWSYPTIGGRLGFHPGPAWDHGISFSIGPYLSTEAAGALPAGQSIGDYDQILLDYDVSYAHGRWQFWAEVFLTRFKVPNVGDADLLAYYLEAKYQLTAHLFAAGRWNQELYANINNGAGGKEPWGNDMYRIDVALGYRFTRHLLSKLQYSFGYRPGAALQQGEQLLAAQVTLKF